MEIFQEPEEIRELKRRKRNRTLMVAIPVALLPIFFWMGLNIFMFKMTSQRQSNSNYYRHNILPENNRITELDARYSAAIDDIETVKDRDAVIDSFIWVTEDKIGTMRKQTDLDAENNHYSITSFEYSKKISQLNELQNKFREEIVKLEHAKGN